jgi:hypothetical protein
MSRLPASWPGVASAPQAEILVDATRVNLFDAVMAHRERIERQDG